MFDKKMTRCALALCALALVFFALPAKAEARDMTLGLAAYAGPSRWVEEAHQLDLADSVTVYYRLPRSPEEVVLAYERYPTSAVAILGLKFPWGPGNTGVLDEINNGEFDESMRRLGMLIREDRLSTGREAVAQLAPEFNGFWNPEAAYAPGNNPADFVPAMRRLIDILWDAAEYEVPIYQNYNVLSYGQETGADGQMIVIPLGTSDFQKLYFGDRYVTARTVSIYGRCGAGPSFTTQPSFDERFEPTYTALAAFSNKPIGIAELGVTSYDDPPQCDTDRIAWNREIIALARNKYSLLDRITWFTETKPIGTASNPYREIVWGYHDPDEIEAFRAFIEDFRREFGQSDRTQVAPERDTQSPWRNLHWRAEGSLFADLSQTFVGVENKARNPVTGNEFGRVGVFFTSRLTQTFRVEVADGVEIGPRFFTGLDFSDEPNMWWTRRFQSGAALDMCFDAKFTLWGDMCAFVEGRHILYLADAPDRFRQGFGGREGEVQVRTGIRVNFGWNLLD